MERRFKTILATLVVAVMYSSSVSAQDGTERMLVKMWKMIKTEVNGKEVKPDHDHLVIVFNKKGQFTETAKFEETHIGKWELSDDKKSVIVTDETMEAKKTVLQIKDLDAGHLALSNFDGQPNKTVYFIPLSKKKASHLTHKEFLICKEWTVDKSEKAETVGFKFVFSVNKTFVILAKDSHVPMSSGKWEMSKDHKTLYMDMKEEGQRLELAIKVLHRHELQLESSDGFVKHFVDHRLVTVTTDEGAEEAPAEEGAEEEAAE